MIVVHICKTARQGYILRWKSDGATKQRKCKGRTARERETDRAKLEEELNKAGSGMTWLEYWDHLDANHLEDMSPTHRAKCKTMSRRLREAAESIGRSNLTCDQIDNKLLLTVESRMKNSKVEPATIASNMNTLWGMLTWGQDYGLISRSIIRPRRRRGKKAKRTRKAKGRSMTPEEVAAFDAALESCVKEGEPVEPYRRALKAAHLIGMRLGEVWNFSWEPLPDAHYPVRLHTDAPAVVFVESQKNGDRCEVPLTRDAAEWLRGIKRDNVWICRTRGPRGPHKTHERIKRVFIDAGRKAGVVVKWKPDGTPKKHASIHDLRRTFATELHSKLNISELQTMTRHADASTLLDYYADASTPELVRKLSEVKQ